MKSTSNESQTARPKLPYWLYAAVIAWVILTIDVFYVGVSRSHSYDQYGKGTEAQITDEYVLSYPLPIARDFSFHAYFVTYVFRTEDSHIFQDSVEVDRDFGKYWTIGKKLRIVYHLDDPSHNCLMIPSQTEYYDSNPIEIFLVGILQALLGIVCLLVYFSKHPRGSILNRSMRVGSS